MNTAKVKTTDQTIRMPADPLGEAIATIEALTPDQREQVWRRFGVTPKKIRGEKNA
ncbi:MAG: hypothetical protein ACFBSC_18525 [Microcoleaceae cyanobacterium]